MVTREAAPHLPSSHITGKPGCFSIPQPLGYSKPAVVLLQEPGSARPGGNLIRHSAGGGRERQTFQILPYPDVWSSPCLCPSKPTLSCGISQLQGESVAFPLQRGAGKGKEERQKQQEIKHRGFFCPTTSALQASSITWNSSILSQQRGQVGMDLN